jgi:hypothetical protein
MHERPSVSSHDKARQPRREDHAPAGDDERPGRVLDRDQPSRERRRPLLSAHPLQSRRWDYSALDVTRINGVVAALGGAVDAFETVANTVEQIAVKES